MEDIGGEHDEVIARPLSLTFVSSAFHFMNGE